MKAIHFRRHGGPDVLEYAEVPEPPVGPGRVAVRLEVAALNRLDLWVREGWPGIKLPLPHIPGADGAGRVASAGESARDMPEGLRVVISPSQSCGECEVCRQGKENLCREWKLLGEHLPGTYAQYVAVPARNVLPLPAGFPPETAAAAALVFHTAWHSLVTRGNLMPGETVVVIGASGGVNTASIQVARHLGARVLVVGSNAQKLQLAEELGADGLIDRSVHSDFSRAVYEATDRQGADVVVDNVIGSTLPLSLRCLRKGGRLLTVGNTAGPKVELDNRYMFGKHLSIIGSTMGTAKDFATVMELVFSGRLRPAIDRTYPLSEAAQAQERLASGQQRGKILLSIS
jgi:NADPH:quinone reductase-like Zn-dependent oxidoreductase